MGQVLSKDDAVARHAQSKISDTDTGVAQFLCIGKDSVTGIPLDGAAHWTALTKLGPFGRPVTVRLYISVTNSVSIQVASQPDHTFTPNNPNGPHLFHDSSQDIGAFTGTKIVDVKGADIIQLTPSADAGICTVIAVPLYY